jgi:hypothetical protein
MTPAQRQRAVNARDARRHARPPSEALHDLGAVPVWVACEPWFTPGVVGQFTAHSAGDAGKRCHYLHRSRCWETSATLAGVSITAGGRIARPGDRRRLTQGSRSQEDASGMSRSAAGSPGVLPWLRSTSEAGALDPIGWGGSGFHPNR